MKDRALGFATMLAVMAISIVFGMILGGKLNAPPAMLAAPARPALQLVPAAIGDGETGGFAKIVERSMPGVVGVTSTSRGSDGEREGAHPFLDDPFFRHFWFFGDPDEMEREPRQRRRVGAGSGFLISPDGYVMTNNHVVDDFERVEVTTTGGRTFEAEVIGADPSIDLALLKIDTAGTSLPALPLGDSDSVRVGEWVIAIGSPHDFDQTVTVGIVSGKGRRVPLPTTDSGVVSFIQTDAAINLGNSGGPLLDARGNVIGINTAIRRQNFAEGIGFALPINQARAVVEQLREQGEVRRGWIGITMNEEGIDDTVRDYYGLPDTSGVLVKAVVAGGPASKAGLRVGDVVRKVDGKRVEDNLDMITKIASHQPGDRVELSVFRRGRVIDMRVTLGDRERGMREGFGLDVRDAPPDREEEFEESSGLGLTVENVSARTRQQLGLDEDQQGVVIVDVDFESDADAKGLRATMVITAVNDQAVRDLADWNRAVDDLRPGSPVKLDVLPPGGGEVLYFFLRASRAED